MRDFRSVNRVVVKVGTSTVAYSNGRLNLRRLEQLVRVLSDLHNRGVQVVLVTSGAVSAGMAALKLPERPKKLPMKQAAAAVGQSELMNIYSRLFAEYGITVAQLLLTKDVIDSSLTRENAENTFRALLELGAVPVVNENDTVSVFELQHITAFGDNDTLSANVASLCDAQLLVLMSDIDGFYDADPRENPEARLIPVIHGIDEQVEQAAGGAGTAGGTGGMATKIAAAKIAGAAGIPMVIVNGQRPDILYEIFDGKSVGTLFLPEGSTKV